MVSVEGEDLRQVTFVIVEEVKRSDWGIGGKAMTTTDVKIIPAGKSQSTVTSLSIGKKWSIHFSRGVEGFLLTF